MGIIITVTPGAANVDTVDPVANESGLVVREVYGPKILKMLEEIYLQKEKELEMKY